MDEVHAIPNDRLPISGEVTLNGSPLKNGDITFSSDPGAEVVSGAKILDGKFKIEKAQGLPAGSYLVTVSSLSGSSAPSGDAMNHPSEFHELVAPEFNQKTKLKAEVKQGSGNQFQFDVTGPQ